MKACWSDSKDVLQLKLPAWFELEQLNFEGKEHNGRLGLNSEFVKTW
jgi:hypothetical protein